MAKKIILASASTARARLLEQAGLKIESLPARVDEDGLKQAYLSDGARPRDIADGLAEAKARKLAMKHPDAWVIGADQVLDFEGQILSKPSSQSDAFDQLSRLSGQAHKLLSAVVIYEDAQPVWRHIGTATLTMRPLSTDYLDDYIARNWESIQHSVGGYLIEQEGVRLFSQIEGDLFTIQGLPLLPLLSYLITRGIVAT